MFSRRDFIKQGLIPVFAGSAVPSVFANGLAATAADSPHAPPSDRVLVLVQLAGGNDGLNTVIPFADGAYHDARPTLRQDQGVLALNGQLGLHPNLKGLKASFDARSEEHTSELQSRRDLVCRLLLEKKKLSQTRMSNVRSRWSPCSGIPGVVCVSKM